MLRKILYVVFLCFVGYPICSAQQLKKAFHSISEIEGFQLIPYSTEEYGYPKEMGEMKMTEYRNSDPRDMVLGFLSSIPDELMRVNYVDDRKKITRVYVEEEKKSGEAVFMQVFIGTGGNDLCVWLFTGATLDYYLQAAQQIYDACFK